MTDLNPRYADACDSGHHTQRVTTLPIIGTVDNDGLLAAYSCPACGHIWTCAWRLVPGRPLPPRPAPGLFPDLAALLAEQAAVNRARTILHRRNGDAA